MATTRESVLQALFTRLQTIAGAKVLRNEVFPEKIPSSGLIILRDGDPGEPDVLLSPLSYFWEHRAIIEVAVQAGGQAERDAALDVLFQDIAFAIGGDKTLGGLCDLVRPLAPDMRMTLSGWDMPSGCGMDLAVLLFIVHRISSHGKFWVLAMMARPMAGLRMF